MASAPWLDLRPDYHRARLHHVFAETTRSRGKRDAVPYLPRSVSVDGFGFIRNPLLYWILSLDFD
jgi:hypothetical protein